MPFLLGSSATALTYDNGCLFGRSPLTRDHVAPKSVVLKMNGSRLSIRCASTATYAVPASKCDGSIFDTTPHDGIPVMFLVTSFHFAPPSREFQSFPSFVPAQTSPRCTSENAIAKTTSPANCPRLSPTMPPEGMIFEASCVERSGLTIFQLCPPLVVWKI